MRAIIRTLINLGLIAATAGTGGWLTTLEVYRHASRDMRIAMLAAAAAAFFILACIVLRAVPSRAQLARRQPSRRTTPHAVTSVKRGR